jgi:hypothetical protein
MGTRIFVLHAPPGIAHEVEEMMSVARVSSRLPATPTVEFVMAFVTRQKQVDDLVRKIVPLMCSDGVLWFAYPKGTSKRYLCEFNRDSGWKELGKFGYEGVRMVAIDEDWSAIRFRKAEHIKSMTRSFAMSAEGKRKVAVSGKNSTGAKKKRSNDVDAA